jgi:hypothetical protein
MNTIIVLLILTYGYRLVAMILFWIMSDEAAKRVKSSMPFLMKDKPIVTIAKICASYLKQKKRFKNWRKQLANADEFRRLLKWPLLHKEYQKALRERLFSIMEL